MTWYVMLLYLSHFFLTFSLFLSFFFLTFLTHVFFLSFFLLVFTIFHMPCRSSVFLLLSFLFNSSPFFPFYFSLVISAFIFSTVQSTNRLVLYIQKFVSSNDVKVSIPFVCLFVCFFAFCKTHPMIDCSVNLVVNKISTTTANIFQLIHFN